MYLYVSRCVGQMLLSVTEATKTVAAVLSKFNGVFGTVKYEGEKC